MQGDQMLISVQLVNCCHAHTIANQVKICMHTPGEKEKVK